jgi:glycosyltransferase involved in cell wall biosynthesis
VSVKQKISVVIPVYNEEENVRPCYQEVRAVTLKMEREMGFSTELIFVDDGSKDDTANRLSQIARTDPTVKVIIFRRNFGQTAAMAAGLDYASGDIVATLDGDMQNDPNEIPRMVEALNEGYDLVAGWRKNRQDALISRKIPSRMANALISKLTRVSLHDYGCTLKVMTKEIAKGIKLYGEMHRFIPALAAEMGARIKEIPVNHRARQFGQSKYGISRTVRVFLDLLTVKYLLGFSKRPIHLFGTLGLLSTFAGFALLALTTFQRFAFHVPMGNRPIVTLGVMLMIIGLQFLVFGLLGEVLARTYYESQDKKIYTVRHILSLGTPAPDSTGGSSVVSFPGREAKSA